MASDGSDRKLPTRFWQETSGWVTREDREALRPISDLATLARYAECFEGVRKSELCPGDWVLVTTRNSTYAICALGNGQYLVSGGWFDRHGSTPATITINGCTWGGRAIHTGLVAARGLFLEFGNQVITTRIQHVRVVRAAEQQRWTVQ
jgi:hypothetical protein